MSLNADRTGPSDGWILSSSDPGDGRDDELADALDFAEWQEVEASGAAG